MFVFDRSTLAIVNIETSNLCSELTLAQDMVKNITLQPKHCVPILITKGQRGVRFNNLNFIEIKKA